MKLKENRYSLCIEPTSEVEIAFMEEVLNLRKADDTAICKRVNVMGLGSMAYLEIKKDDRRERAEAWRPHTLPEHLCESSEVPKEAVLAANFAKSMYKYASTIKELYHDIPSMQLRLLDCVNDGHMVEAAVLCMFLREATSDKEA